jgi:type I restriction enzyme, S subunit
MREMKDSGVAWIGEIPNEWTLIRYKDKYKNSKEIAGDKSSSYERLALTLNGVIKRPKDDSDGLQPKEFDTYQVLHENDFVFKMIDLQNISTSRVGLSPYTGLVSPAYIRFRPKSEKQYPRFIYYFLMSMYYNCVFNHLGGDGVRSALNSSDMGMLLIPYPIEPEQRRIADYLDTACGKVDALIANQQAQIEKLRAYKQSLITEVVTHGLDPDAPMKDSGVEWIGMIPQGWKISSVRYIGTLQNGISKGGDAFGSGYPFVSYGDVYKNYELPVNVNGLIETNEKERNIYSVEYGDIFFTRTSETIEEVGFSCVCKQTIPNATFAGFVIRLRPQKADEKIITDYAKYYFRGNHIRAYLVKEMNLVTRASLGQTLLKGMPITLPPKEEQQQIADYLDTKCAKIDALIAIKQQKIEKLTQYKKSLIYEYVTGKKEAI